MFKVEKNKENQFTLYIPESFVYVENEMDVGLYVSFSKENLERIFKASGFDFRIVRPLSAANLNLNLGIFKLTVLDFDSNNYVDILLWVVKGKE